MPEDEEEQQQQIRQFSDPSLGRLTVAGGGSKGSSGKQNSSQFYTHRQTHFANVSELVELVCQWLDSRGEVLAAASVNYRWREALMWDGFQEDVKGVPKVVYQRERTLQSVSTQPEISPSRIE